MTKAINHNTNSQNNTVGVPPTTPKAHQKANVKKDIKQDITDKIIALMEAGPEAWQKTWSDSAAAGMPTNATTGAPYRGVNVLTLVTSDRTRLHIKPLDDIQTSQRRGRTSP